MDDELSEILIEIHSRSIQLPTQHKTCHRRSEDATGSEQEAVPDIKRFTFEYTKHYCHDGSQEPHDGGLHLDKTTRASKHHDLMMTSSNGNIFRVTDPLCGEFTGDRWIPRTKASDGELWCFLWSAPE